MSTRQAGLHGHSKLASVIGHGFKTNPLNAAFANGVSGHCLDFELQGQPSSHGTSSILPGPLALAEAHGGVSGKELIAAYALGWDVQPRIVAASHRAGANLRGFHPPGVYGPLGGTAGSIPFPSTRGSDTTSSRASSTFRPMT